MRSRCSVVLGLAAAVLAANAPALAASRTANPVKAFDTDNDGTLDLAVSDQQHGAALGAAVLVANALSVQHGFWVVLGTLSVLRSNALSTGQDAVRAVVGTTIGVVVGGALVYLVGAKSIVLWALFPVAVALAGVAPGTISFAAGQAAFTLTLVKAPTNITASVATVPAAPDTQFAQFTPTGDAWWRRSIPAMRRRVRASGR